MTAAVPVGLMFIWNDSVAERFPSTRSMPSSMCCTSGEGLSSSRINASAAVPSTIGRSVNEPAEADESAPKVDSTKARMR